MTGTSVSLSKRIGIENRETVVSAAIAVAFDGRSGRELLAALLDDPDGVEGIVAVRSEFSIGSVRPDVLLLYENGGRVFPLLVEVKVTANEGRNQIAKYLSLVEEESFEEEMREILGEGDSRELAGGRVLYLTVAPSEDLGDGVIRRDFAKWNETVLNIDLSSEVDDLETMFMLDMLRFFGVELAPERALISRMSPDTDLAEFRRFHSDGLTLSKKVRDALFEIIRAEFDDLNQELGSEERFSCYWDFTGRGANFGFHFFRFDWGNSYSPSTSGEPGFLLNQMLEIDLHKLSSERPALSLKVKFSPEPYAPRKELERLLTETQLDEFRRLRDAFRAFMGELALQGLPGYSQQGYFMQVGEIQVPLRTGESSNEGVTLREVAAQLWETALKLADAMDSSLAQLRRSNGAITQWVDPDNNRTPAFNLRLKGDQCLHPDL